MTAATISTGDAPGLWIVAGPDPSGPPTLAASVAHGRAVGGVEPLVGPVEGLHQDLGELADPEPTAIR